MSYVDLQRVGCWTSLVTYFNTLLLVIRHYRFHMLPKGSTCLISLKICKYLQIALKMMYHQLIIKQIIVQNEIKISYFIIYLWQYNQ